MARVFIPSLVQAHTGGAEEVTVPGNNIGQVLDHLEDRFPGIGNLLADGDRLKSGLTVAIDGNIDPRGLRAKVAENSEVHFLPGVGGG